MSASRRSLASNQNLLAKAMSQGRAKPPGEEGSLSVDELTRIKKSIVSAQNSKLNATDLILMVARLPPEQRSPELVHSKITDYFQRKGETSLNKWQINACVRQVMNQRSTVTHDDLNNLEAVIRRKETGLPGSKLSSP